MTKSELLAELAPYPNDALIVLATDDEGTKCVPLAGDVSAGYWRLDTGEFDDQARWDDQQFRKRRNVVAAVCLWPGREEVNP